MTYHVSSHSVFETVAAREREASRSGAGGFGLGGALLVAPRASPGLSRSNGSCWRRRLSRLGREHGESRRRGRGAAAFRRAMSRDAATRCTWHTYARGHIQYSMRTCEVYGVIRCRCCAVTHTCVYTHVARVTCMLRHTSGAC